MMAFESAALELTLFAMVPTVETPGPVAAAFRSVAGPQRRVSYASGPLGRETPQPRGLATPRDGTMVN